MDKPTPDEIYNAAIRWCGQKERETFPEDVIYFQHNWQWFPGLRRRVEEEIANRQTTHD